MTRTLKLVTLLSIALALSAQGAVDSRQELEQSLQSRYRPAVIGKGMIGIGGENSIRRAGGTVALRRAGLWGSFDRRETASWAIRGDRCELLVGHKDVELQTGQTFYVTSVSVGLDVVQIGLASVGTVSNGGRNGRLWATAAFFFDEKVVAQGDMATIEPAINQWLSQGGTVTPSPAAPASAAPAIQPETHAPPSELKVGMTREQVVQAAGAPLSEVSFGTRTWLTYPDLVAVLEENKLVTVDRSLQPPSKLSVRSDPAGAEIYLDGKFIGNTPGNLQLAAGTYTLSLKLQGYGPWQRELSVISGSETGVQAKLEASAAK
ncbi:MAG: PEGA domain-containing protein [Acidobacteriia bacterium]|nr:PEGA domain-containing protein [Terriglobia bacterium]